MRSWTRLRPAIFFAAGLAVAGCSETRLITHAAKQASRPDEPAAAVQRPKPGYKVGNPYQINGVWYYPQEDPNYDQTGIGSWYGDPFHGRYTANGEVYDQNEVTAAHQTLPMPSYVRVTNLENGRSVVARVNDRGPFVNGRIIDMSRRSAQLLGFDRQGTAKLRVQYIGSALADGDGGPGRLPTEEKPPVVPAPRAAVVAEALPLPNGAADRTTVIAAPAAPPPSATSLLAASARPSPRVAGLPSDPVLTQPVYATSIYVQAGAFSQYDNANRLSARLGTVGPATVSSINVNGAEFFRVRVGPLPSVEQADAALAQVISLGQADAKIVVD